MNNNLNDICIPKTGIISLHVEFEGDSFFGDFRNNNYSFVIVVSARNIKNIHPFTSIQIPHSFLVVENSLPQKWFKDEGGRKNTLQLSINLLHSTTNQIVKNIIPIQLKLTLFYANDLESPIEKQHILIPSNQTIHLVGGKSTIDFKITELSSSHNHNQFIVKVEAINALGVIPTFSSPVKVMSKQNKTQNNNSPESINNILTPPETPTPTPTTTSEKTHYSSPLSSRKIFRLVKRIEGVKNTLIDDNYVNPKYVYI